MALKMGHDRPLRGCPYWGIADFILQHGCFWPFSPKPQPVHWGTPRECFRNATHLALRDERLTYVEGYAVYAFPTLHAWVVDPEGTMIDVTWKDEGSHYFGIPFRTEYVCQVLQTAKYHCLLDQWRDNWPLLRGDHPLDQAINYELLEKLGRRPDAQTTTLPGQVGPESS